MASFKCRRKSNKAPIKRLEKLKKFKLSVGWFDATYEDGTPVSKVAMIQEFGAPEKNIPPRPFMRLANMEHNKEWADQMKQDMEMVHKGTAKQVDILNELGDTIIRDIRQSIMDVTTPPLKPNTIKNRQRKGNYSEKPLIDTKRMFDTLDKRVEMVGGKR